MDDGGFFQITIDDGRPSGSEILARKFATYGARIDDLSEPFEQIGEDLLMDFAANFDTEGQLFAGAVGSAGAWAPLAESTIRDRIAKGFGAGPILYRTGALRDSFAVRGGPDNVFEVGPDHVTVGSTNPYAGFHHFAEDGGRLPRRPLVGFTWERRMGIVRRMQTWLNTFFERYR